VVGPAGCVWSDSRGLRCSSSAICMPKESARWQLQVRHLVTGDASCQISCRASCGNMSNPVSISAWMRHGHGQCQFLEDCGQEGRCTARVRAGQLLVLR
jgi:hypothetical protein